jgi:hypothetical protein
MVGPYGTMRADLGGCAARCELIWGHAQGDWDCQVCGTLCFASRGSCFKCDASKPVSKPGGGGGGGEALGPSKRAGCSENEASVASETATTPTQPAPPQMAMAPAAHARRDPPSSAQLLQVLQAPDAEARREPAASAQLLQTADKSSAECCVCMEGRKSHSFVPCGHLCVCSGCADGIMSASKECPMCRQVSMLCMRVFI